MICSLKSKKIKPVGFVLATLVANHPLSTNLFTGRGWGVTSSAKDIFISKKFCGCEKLSFPRTMLNDQKKIGIIGFMHFDG